MRWIGLLLGVLVGTVVAAYLSMVFELDRMLREPPDDPANRRHP